MVEKHCSSIMSPISITVTLTHPKEKTQNKVKPCLSLLHLGCYPACCGGPRSPAAETAPPAPAPGSADSSSPPPRPPRAAWTRGVRTTLTESASPSLPGRVPLTDTGPPPARQPDAPASAAALRAGSSGGSLWRYGEPQRSVVGSNGFGGPPLLGLWWRSPLQVGSSPGRSCGAPAPPLPRLPAWCWRWRKRRRRRKAPGDGRCWGGWGLGCTDGRRHPRWDDSLQMRDTKSRGQQWYFIHGYTVFIRWYISSVRFILVFGKQQNNRLTVHLVAILVNMFKKFKNAQIIIRFLTSTTAWKSHKLNLTMKTT